MIRTNKGFTLIELMVVIVIIGVLAALAIPKFTDASTKAKLSEIPTVMGSWDHAMLAYIAETGSVATTTADLAFDAPTASKWFGYAHTGGGAAAGVYTATVAAGKTVGPYDDATAGATSTIADATANPVHDLGGFAAKYIANFE
jgi:prepilin-type N-terminal cleavage/methylation domain-containing protein